jgi:5-methyltetrahydrofolate--homocysteine methyltransferase
MGTMLYASGFPREEPAEMALLNVPERVKAIHAAYREAGAGLLTTNTFQAHRLALERRGLGAHFEEINRKAVALARAEAKERYVVASIGPPGQPLSPLGDTTFRDAVRAYREQIALLEDAGVDGFLLETFTDLLDLQAALQAAREVTQRPVIASVAPVEAKVDGRLLTPEAEARLAEAMGVAAVGVNCLSPDATLRALVRMRGVTSLPLLARPSAGLPDRNGNYPIGPEEFSRWGEELLAAGTMLLGGCCGTTPAHIASLAPLL